MDIGSTIRAIRKRKNITIAQICEDYRLVTRLHESG
jgi:transcriptional regulator with XRE-family HTH domain